MAEQIYTIPINEAFAQKDGCPLCRLKKKLESDSLEYIMGAAMMEPDVRQVTNRTGFCRVHYDDMLAMKNRLSVALTMESRLTQIASLLGEEATDAKGRRSRIKKYAGADPSEEIASTAHTCFVCSRVAGFEEKYIDNTIHLWKKDPEFRTLFEQQPCFCLDHYAALTQMAKKSLSEDLFLTFHSSITAVLRRYLAQLREDVTGFTRCFDYRSGNTPMTEAQKTAVERGAAFLSGQTRT